MLNKNNNLKNLIQQFVNAKDQSSIQEIEL